MKYLQTTSRCIITLALWWAFTTRGSSVPFVASAGLTAEKYPPHGSNDTLLIQRFLDIVERPVPFHDKDEEEKCKVTTIDVLGT